MDKRKSKNYSGNERQRKLQDKESENSELQGLRELTRQQRTTTTEAKDRKNGLKKEKGRQRKPKTGRIEERARSNDCGSHRQREWTEEKERRTAGTKDRGTSNLFFNVQYVTSHYSSLSDRRNKKGKENGEETGLGKGRRDKKPCEK